jgi:hypothetical protein
MRFSKPQRCWRSRARTKQCLLLPMR